MRVTPSFQTALLLVCPQLAAASPLQERDSSPKLPHDPNTVSKCTWWEELEQDTPCADFLSRNELSLDQFRQWNPSIGSNCKVLAAGKSYCVEAAAPGDASTPTTSSGPTPVAKANNASGIKTPTPTQANMVDNCNKFHRVQSGEACHSIATAYGLALEDFLRWNPSAGQTCSSLWADTYACVSVVGHVAEQQTTPTRPSNGVTTPRPIQPNMVTSCNKFHLVHGGETCLSIASAHGITLDQFLRWNPAAGKDCSSLWADTHACVSVLPDDVGQPANARHAT
ncbi:LysM domain-containing protein [Moelleriella libera RCEF 2490]|uniref:LysM domain-containing protein n=1 Tax=Moelleriella libera RCEF 2490 TaxID=1081109 RepID=A0A162IH30_9HYPO|nr:LysM domain-containing protein [Moelleriella libera RCEF 2490]